LRREQVPNSGPNHRSRVLVAKPEVNPLPEANGNNGQADKRLPGSSKKNATDPQVFELEVRTAFLGDGQFNPYYFDAKKKTLYRWKGVVLRREQIPQAGPYNTMPVLIAKDFSVVPVEAAVKYRKIDGEYRPGYLDWSSRVFYEWKGVVLSKREVLAKSQDGRTAILDPNKFSRITEIDLPAHLKEQPGLWKKT
jgi:hypothetical protein